MKKVPLGEWREPGLGASQDAEGTFLCWNLQLVSYHLVFIAVLIIRAALEFRALKARVIVLVHVDGTVICFIIFIVLKVRTGIAAGGCHGDLLFIVSQLSLTL